MVGAAGGCGHTSACLADLVGGTVGVQDTTGGGHTNSILADLVDGTLGVGDTAGEDGHTDSILALGDPRGADHIEAQDRKSVV